MIKATIAGLRGHKGRLALTALAVVLGVAFVAGSFILSDTITATFNQLFAEAGATTDVSVRSEAAFEEESNTGSSNREPLPESLLAVVAGVDGVRTAEGVVQGYAQFVDKEGEAVGGMGPPTLGFNWPTASDLSPFKIREGRAPAGPGEVVVDAGTAASAGFDVGDRVTVLLAGPAEEFTIVGIAGFGEADNLAGATAAMFETDTAQRVLQRQGQFDSIEVAGEPELTEEQLRDRIAAVLPEGVEAITQQEAADEASDAILAGFGFFTTALLAFAGISLFVGAFIIHNTFAMLVAQRTRELGLLRALGASRRQIIGSVTLEAALVGLFAALLGMIAGFGMAVGLQALLSAFGVDLPSTDVQLLPRTVIVSLIVGVGVTVVSAIGPGRRAARIAPVTALAEGEYSTPVGSVGRRALAGTIVTLLALALLYLGLSGGAFAAVAGGALLLFVGVAVLSPAIAGPVVATIGAPLSRRKIPTRLGRENAAQNPRRTASTASALMIGMALVVFAAIFAASIKASAIRVIDESLRADLFVQSESFGGMSTAVRDELDAEPAVGTISALRGGEFQVDGERRGLNAADPNIDQLLAIEMVEGDISALAEERLLVDEDAAERHGWSVGDVVRLEFARTGVRELTVGGIYEPVELIGPYLISNQLYAANYSTVLDGIVLMDAAAGATTDDLRAAVNRVADRYANLEVRDQAEFKEDLISQVNQLLALVTVLLALAIIIAVLGIVNTLALSIIERTREIGLLRAVGMSRRQVRSMVRVESVLVAVLGGILGTLVGILLGWMILGALSDEGFNTFQIPFGQLALFLLVSAIVGVVAAVLPARRAARMDVLAAIQHT